MLIPEQASYQTETALANSGLGGTLRVQTLSFKRLGWHILSETGGHKQIIGDLGKRMVLQKILLAHRHSLQAYSRIAEKFGLADQLAQTLREFKLYGITLQELSQISPADEVLARKIKDTVFIFEEYERLLGTYIDAEDELIYIAEKIDNSDQIKRAMIWVDGFIGFTGPELKIFERLLVSAQKVVVTLPLAEEFLCDKTQPIGEEFFSLALDTYHRLKRIALAHQIAIEPDITLKSQPRFTGSLPLAHMEKYLFKFPAVPYTKEEPAENAVQIISALNKYHEIEEIAREIWVLVRSGYRWRNIAVLSRNLEEYQDLLAKIFHQYDIPYYIDAKHYCIEHPIIDFILSALEVAESHWSYDAVFRCLKTGFFKLDRDVIDRLENYCLKYGIGGNDWQPSNQWTFGKNGREVPQAVVKSIAHAREQVQKYLWPFTSSFASPAEKVSVKEATRSLYELLVALDVSTTLKSWAHKAQQNGNIIEAQIHAQIWDAVIDVFDQIVFGLGEESLTLSDYSVVLQSGLEGIQLGTVPMGLDQVFVGSLERSRPPEADIVFILGANEGILPHHPEPIGVFSEAEREQLIANGIGIPGENNQLNQEYFFVYYGLTRASAKIYLTYSLTDDEGKPLEPSPIVHRLKTIFPGLREKFFSPSHESLRLICRPQPLLPLYATQIQQSRFGNELSAFWQSVEKALSEIPETSRVIKHLKQTTRRQNQEPRIPRELTRKLYGKRLRLSVSRLEEFSRCPFAHFVHHGLKLRERQTYQVRYPDLGNFFHQILRAFAQEVANRGLQWGELSWEQSWSLIEELAGQILPEIQNRVLLSTARYRYLTRKLKRTAHYAVRVLGEHARKGVFAPIYLEIKFGPHEAIPGRTIPLSMGESLILTGQIDRVDSTVIDNTVYLRVIDYKSSETPLNLDTIYHGLNLQLLTYLDVVLSGAVLEVPVETQLVPAGILYFPIVEPVLSEASPLTPEAIHELKLDAVKVKGYLLAEPKVLESMDSDLKQGVSRLLGLKLTSKGEFRKDAPLLSVEDFQNLRKYLNYLFYKTGEEMYNGEIAIAPYRYGSRTGCDFCAYKAICQFDANLPENRYRDLPKIKDQEVLRRIAEQRTSEDPGRDQTRSDVTWLDEHIDNSGEGR